MEEFDFPVALRVVFGCALKLDSIHLALFVMWTIKPILDHTYRLSTRAIVALAPRWVTLYNRINSVCLNLVGKITRLRPCLVSIIMPLLHVISSEDGCCRSLSDSSSSCTIIRSLVDNNDTSRGSLCLGSRERKRVTTLSRSRRCVIWMPNLLINSMYRYYLSDGSFIVIR